LRKRSRIFNSYCTSEALLGLGAIVGGLPCDQIKLYGESSMSMILARLENTFGTPSMQVLAALIGLDHDRKVIEVIDGC